MARTSFRNRMLIYLGLGSLQSAFSLLLTPAYAHILPVREFGLFGLLLSFEQLFVLLMDLGLSGGAVRTYYDERRHGDMVFSGPTIVSYFQRLALIGSSAMMALIALALIGYDALKPQPVEVVIGFGLTIASAWFQRINSLAGTTYRAQEDARSFAILALSRMIGLTATTLLILFVFDWGLMGVIGTRVAVFGLTAAYELYHTIQPRLPPEEDASVRALIRRSVRRFSFPQLPHELMKWGRTRGNRVVIAGSLNLASLGIYNAALAPASVLQLTSTAFNRAFEPFFYREMRKGEEAVAHVLNSTGALFLTIQAGMALLVIAVLPEAFRLLFPAPYHAAGAYAPLFVAANFVSSMQSLLIKALLDRGEVKFMPLITGMSTLIGLTATYALAHSFGLSGAVFGSLFTALLAVLFTWLALNRKLRDRTFPAAEALVLGGVLIVTALLPSFLQVEWLSPHSLWWRLPLLGGMAACSGVWFMLRHPETLRLVLAKLWPGRFQAGSRKVSSPATDNL